jgi:hypothetical protein
LPGAEEHLDYLPLVMRRRRTNGFAPAKTGLPDWPRYSPDKDNIQAIDLPSQKQVGGYGKMYDCEFWDPIIASQIWPQK